MASCNAGRSVRAWGTAQALGRIRTTTSGGACLYFTRAISSRRAPRRKAVVAHRPLIVVRRLAAVLYLIGCKCGLRCEDRFDEVLRPKVGRHARGLRG
eukprot:5394964-Prymnesium_polylepis.1